MWDVIGLYCFVGIGDNKVWVKIVMEFGKLCGVFWFMVENWFEVMGD